MWTVYLWHAAWTINIDITHHDLFIQFIHPQRYHLSLFVYVVWSFLWSFYLSSPVDAQSTLCIGCVCAGIRSPCEIGFLTEEEARCNIEVGRNYKHPLQPIWVLHGGMHYSVLVELLDRTERAPKTRHRFFWFPGGPRCRYYELEVTWSGHKHVHTTTGQLLIRLEHLMHKNMCDFIRHSITSRFYIVPLFNIIHLMKHHYCTWVVPENITRGSLVAWGCRE